jgi:hypothetical protein
MIGQGSVTTNLCRPLLSIGTALLAVTPICNAPEARADNSRFNNSVASCVSQRSGMR